ncbi:MAG: MFS transporter, partial [Alistipes sp.]|nr:MFS transporter [Alistipes sp.]
MSVTAVNKSTLYPALMGFFIMGFCDIIAPITGKIAEQYADHAALVSFLPSMVFLWLLLLSTPLASIANRRGRKFVALIGYALTVAGLSIPFAAGKGCDLTYYFIGFALVGMGNTAVQVAVNPMLAMIVPEAKMTSYLTIGQICRNISIMLVGPLVLLLGADWSLLFVIYAALTVIGAAAMWRSPLQDAASDDSRSVSMADCFRLLGNSRVAMC